jgi:two-component system phosphate regulon response regulator PhoB
MAKILIIEDDAELQQLLSHALFRHNYEVHHAFNGKEGYEKVLSLRPDLIVLDLMLPAIPGTDLLRMFQENVMLRDIPVIVMTAYGDKSDMLERSIRAQGAREYIRKPFRPAEIVSLIKRTLEQYPKEKSSVPRQYAKGVVRLDSGYRTLFIQDKLIGTLTPKETQILQILLDSKGPVSRSSIIQKVWGSEGNDNILYKTIQRIRDHLGEKESRRLQTHPDAYELLGD